MFGLIFRQAPAGSRRHRFARWWREYVGSIAFVSILLLAALGFARVENARYESCAGGNLLREGLRQAEYQSIAQTQNANPSLFPSLAPSVFEKLKRESIARSLEHITVNYAPRPCGTHIVFPFTGATVVLPLGG